MNGISLIVVPARRSIVQSVQSYIESTFTCPSILIVKISRTKFGGTNDLKMKAQVPLYSRHTDIKFDTAAPGPTASGTGSDFAGSVDYALMGVVYHEGLGTISNGAFKFYNKYSDQPEFERAACTPTEANMRGSLPHYKRSHSKFRLELFFALVTNSSDKPVIMMIHFACIICCFRVVVCSCLTVTVLISRPDMLLNCRSRSLLCCNSPFYS